MTSHRRGAEPSSDPSRNIQLQDVIAFLRRGAAVVALVAVAAGAAAFLLSSRADPTYRATSALLAAQPTAGPGNVDLIQPAVVDPTVYRAALLEGSVVREVLERLEGRSRSDREMEAFLRRVRVTVEDHPFVSSIIRVQVDHTDPALAARLANGFADALIDWDRDRARQTVVRSVEAFQRAIADIDAEVARLAATGESTPERQAALAALRSQRQLELDTALARSEAAVVVSLLEPLRSATVPEEAVGPRVVFNTFVAVVLAIAVGYGFLFLTWSLDPRVGGRDELMALTGLPVLAEFPKRNRRAHRLSAEAASFFRTNVAIATRSVSPLIIAVTSARHPREKEGVAVSLAESFARDRQRTLLIDANLRQPGATKGLDVSSVKTPPFEVYLANAHQRFMPATVAVGGKRTFDFVPSFTSARHPVELLSQGFPERLHEWQQHYDVIIIDTTPVLPYADTLAIAPLVTGLVLSISAVETTREHIQDSLDLMAQGGFDVLGMVVTNAPQPRGRGATPFELSVADRAAVDPYRTFVHEPDQPPQSR